MVIHFTINDIDFAEKSVDTRMLKEIESGQKVIESIIKSPTSNNIRDIIKVNQGGPYGSNVLKQVQRDSEQVWKLINDPNTSSIDSTWYKALISITARDDQPWFAQGVNSDGEYGEIHTFEAV